MPTLRIEHPVPDFAARKAAFDRDPVRREHSGVRRYRILRPVEDPHYVLVDLESDSVAAAAAMQAALRELWGRVEGTGMTNPQVRIVETVERKEYGLSGRQADAT